MNEKHVIAIVVLALGASVALLGTASGDTTEVQLHEDGDATVVFEWEYDLKSEGDREAFVSLKQDESTQQQMLEEFVTSLEDVSETTSEKTGQEVSVGNATVGLEQTEGVGTVRYTVEWQGLAVVDEESDRLAVSEPFASGFETDRLRVEAPEGYVLETDEPEPTESTEASAEWSGGSLEGFEVVAASTEDGGGKPVPDEGLPGFGFLVSLVAAVAVALVRNS